MTNLAQNQKIDDLEYKHILIIDDDESFIDLMEKYLEGVGNIKIEKAFDGDEGFRKVLFCKPDLLIIDINLPETNGVKLSYAIDILNEHHIPTIFVSANAENEIKVANMKINPDVYFFKKPIDKFSFKECVQMVLSEGPKILRKNIGGYEKKPLGIRFIGWMHIFEPIIKIIFLKITTAFSFTTVISNVLEVDSAKAIFEFWFLFPLAGISLLSVRKWSYGFFLAAQTYAIYSHLSYKPFMWPYVSEKPLAYSIVLIFINVLIICYMLLPKTRRPFFDRNVRWWERAERFTISIPCSFSLSEREGIFQSTIHNISESGCFLSTDTNLELFDSIELKFQFYQFQFTIRGRVMNVHTMNGVEGFGIKFKLIQFGEKWEMKRFVKAIKLLKS